MSPSRGFCAELSTALITLIASQVGLWVPCLLAGASPACRACLDHPDCIMGGWVGGWVGRRHFVSIHILAPDSYHNTSFHFLPPNYLCSGACRLAAPSASWAPSSASGCSRPTSRA